MLKWTGTAGLQYEAATLDSWVLQICEERPEEKSHQSVTEARQTPEVQRWVPKLRFADAKEDITRSRVHIGPFSTLNYLLA